MKGSGSSTKLKRRVGDPSGVGAITGESGIDRLLRMSCNSE
jgi:hypothetical protein